MIIAFYGFLVDTITQNYIAMKYMMKRANNYRRIPDEKVK